MVEEPQVTTNLLKRGNELNFPPSTNASPPPPLIDQGDIAIQQPKPVPEKSSDLNQHRKLIARQQSITRGTASSLAKAVRPNLNDAASATTTANTAETLIKRRISVAAGARTRKQSITTSPPPIVEANGQRRYSGLPAQTHNITTTVVPELPSSPSPSPPPPMRKVLEAKRRASMVPASDNTAAISSSDNVDRRNGRRSSLLLQKRPSKYSSVIANTDDGNQDNKTACAIDNNNAASSAGNQQQTPSSNSSCFVDGDSPDIITDEVHRPSSNSSTSTSSSLEHTHHHHHHTHTHTEDDHLPSYMRRPICAACNRNVKVTSSSESTTAAASAAAAANASVHVTKSNSTATSSRRSSVSLTASKSIDRNGHKKRSLAHSNEGSPNLASATSSLSTVGSHRSIQSMTSNSSSSSSSTHSHSNLLCTRALGSHSPTSPIPTRKRTKKRSTLAIEHPGTVIKKPSNQLIEKWSQLLSQQQLLLATIGGGTANAEDDQELNSIQENITKLVTSTQEQYETVLLETQAKILQKFTLLMMQQQQKQQQKDALLFLSTSSTKSLPFGVPGSAATITPINIYSDSVATTNYNTTTRTPTTPTTITESSSLPIQSCNWQTKLEYGVTRFKWNMSQWIGSIVGTGDIEEQDFDTLGYPKNVIISGVCVTTEPGLLPKGLQKYFKPYQQPDQVICHKYIIHLSRQSRLTKFQLLSQHEWVQDDHAKTCQFKIQDRHDYIKRMKHCDAEFGMFQRRHHCRSCGHVFCQEHSSNKLPLFVSNGQDCGEWARVCDTCFYSRIEPQLLSRS